MSNGSPEAKQLFIVEIGESEMVHGDVIPHGQCRQWRIVCLAIAYIMSRRIEL